MGVAFENDKAFAPMTEPVTWRQSAAPHRSGVFGAVLLQGAVESASAGPSVETQLADAWTVHVSNQTALVADVAVGDTLSNDWLELSVQQITRNQSGWWIVCTVNERAPH